MPAQPAYATDYGNGDYVTRAELGAHLRRIDENIDSVHQKLDTLIAASENDEWLGPRGWQIAKWAGRVVAAGVIATVGWALSHFLG